MALLLCPVFVQYAELDYHGLRQPVQLFRVQYNIRDHNVCLYSLSKI